MKNVDQQYIDIGNQILSQGNDVPSRAGAARMIFNASLEHDMADGFPLLRCKRVAWKPMFIEWLGFMNGITDKGWYQAHGCHIWDSWHNPTSKNKNDLGPIYGRQWRRFNNAPIIGDQIIAAVDLLAHNPYDRRAVISAWNPLQQHEMALPPCHYSFNLVYDGKRLNLVWNQRSADWALGVPFDLAHYGLMLNWFAEQVSMVPGRLVGHFANAHLYKDQIETWKDLGSSWLGCEAADCPYARLESTRPFGIGNLCADSYRASGYVNNGTFNFPLSA